MALYTPIDGALPEPSKFGLLNSKTLVTAGADNWASGIAVEPFVCNVDSRVVEICNTSHTVSSSAPGDATNSYIPFAIQAEYKCSTFGFENNDYKKKAQ